MENYRVEITRVENGFTVRLGNDNKIEMVYESLECLIVFVRKYFEEHKT